MVPYRVANLEHLKPDTKYRKDHKYYEIPAALDIETTRTGTDPQKDFAFVYLWAFAVGDFVVYGRSVDELLDFLPTLRGELRLAPDFRLVVYVHFLKYEFAFLKKYLQIEDAGFIARSKNEPLRVLCDDSLELRDSYTYTEQPLELMGREIGLHKVEVEDGFYDEIRTPQTKLTAHELEYQENDVLILTRYFERESNFYGGLSRVPLTATLRVQRVIAAELDRYSERIKWRIYSQQLDPALDEDRMILNLLHIAFFGGFNYCNELHAGTTIDRALGADLDTSYGAQCIFHRFPRSKFKPLPVMPDGIVPPGMFQDILNGTGQFKDKALLIVCEINNIEAIVPELGFLPLYCKNYITRSIDRKRSMKSHHLTKCDHIETVLTDVDFRLMCKLYKFDEIKIHGIMASNYDPLPEYVLQSIIDMIAQKKATKEELQEVKKFRQITEEENAEYHRIKSMVSRIYGLFVKDPIRMEFSWDKEAQAVKSDGIKIPTADKDGKKKVNFAPVLYQWGVWVASWGRWEIVNFLLQLGAIGGQLRGIAADGSEMRWNRQILYSDTDCVKWFGLGLDAIKLVNEYNDRKARHLERFCAKRTISIEWLLGLGGFDLEQYVQFRAVGMKQYAETKIIDGETVFDYHISGLTRQDWIKKADGTKKNRGCTFFDKWTDPAKKLAHLTPDMQIPAEETHLNATHFIEDERECCITDRDGNCMHISARSCILLVPKSFNLRQSLIERIKSTDSDALRLSAKRNFEGVL